MSASVMSRSTLRKFIPVAIFCFASMLLALPALADSQARMVRLSDVQGSVQIDKNSGAGFENAFLNLPVTQGAQIRTNSNGRTEIEFEDGSTMRLTPNTTVQFSTLSTDDSGKHTSVVNLVEGMAYVNWTSKSDRLSVNFSREKVDLDHPAHFRVETSTTVATFGVFKGDVAVAGPSGTVTVSKKKSVSFATSDDDKATVAQNLEENAFDSWDKESIQYHDQYAKNNVSSPYGYGMSDLNYYGSFSNVAGYGMMWQPYFTGVGWDPFMDGAWAYYPGFGYTFVSAYPWGWMPYRYGNWMFVPGFGWMWQPGYWNTFAYLPRYSGVVPARFRVPTAPTGTVHTVAVGRGGIGTAAPPSRVLLTQGSAGLGVTRGSVNNLKSLNHEVAKTGSVSMRPTPEFGRTSVSRATGSSASPVSGSAGPSRGSVGSSGASHASAPVHSAPSAPSHSAPSPHR